MYDPFVTAERTGATFFPTVPAYLDALVRMGEPPPRPPSLRLVITAGAPLSAATSARFRETFGLPVHVFYGSSECGGICYDREGGAAERGTVGAPVEGVRSSWSRPCPDDAGRAGHRRVRRRRRPATCRTPTPRLAGGRFLRRRPRGLAGTASWRSAGGWTTWSTSRGRRSTRARSRRSSPALAGVDEAVVLGVPLAGRGELLRAVIACRPGSLTADEVLAWCRSHLLGAQGAAQRHPGRGAAAQLPRQARPRGAPRPGGGGQALPEPPVPPARRPAARLARPARRRARSPSPPPPATGGRSPAPCSPTTWSSPPPASGRAARAWAPTCSASPPPPARRGRRDRPHLRRRARPRGHPAGARPARRRRHAGDLLRHRPPRPRPPRARRRDRPPRPPGREPHRHPPPPLRLLPGAGLLRREVERAQERDRRGDRPAAPVSSAPRPACATRSSTGCSTAPASASSPGPGAASTPSSRTRAAIARRLLRGLAPGDILLLHDGRAPAPAAGNPVVLEVLPRVLERRCAAPLGFAVRCPLRRLRRPTRPDDRGEPAKKSRGRFAREIRDLLYKLRTEGMSPGKQAAAVALGVFIGCTPVLRLPPGALPPLRPLFRLNLALTYLAAHVSLPGSPLPPPGGAGDRPPPARAELPPHPPRRLSRELGFRQVGG